MGGARAEGPEKAGNNKVVLIREMFLSLAALTGTLTVLLIHAFVQFHLPATSSLTRNKNLLVKIFNGKQI